ISSGSSSRNSREKLSWLGGPRGRSTISASSPSLAAVKSAMSTQDFAPHKVAIKEMNSIEAQSCRALKSRGSRTSRRIVISVCIQASPNQEASSRILFYLQRNTPILICDSPAPRGRRPLGPALGRNHLEGEAKEAARS